jgi:putative membrane protein
MRFTLIAVASLAAGTAFAQSSPRTIPPSGLDPPGEVDKADVGGTDLTKVDQKFVRDAASANRAQIELGQLAADRGASPKVRLLGQNMVDEHQQIAGRLQEVAAQQGIALPDEPTIKQKSDYDRLSSLSGKHFDRAYVAQVKSDEHRATAIYRYEAKNGIDPNLRSLAESSMPSLRNAQRVANRPSHRM